MPPNPKPGQYTSSKAKAKAGRYSPVPGSDPDAENFNVGGAQVQSKLTALRFDALMYQNHHLSRIQRSAP